uniref:BZIP domain-containing protein n=1 Tax=Myripristis murdjan TaxID=586833 RepID=A0A667XPH6_9TELE
MGDRREVEDNSDTASLISPISFDLSPYQNISPDTLSPVEESSDSPHLSPTTPDLLEKRRTSVQEGIANVNKNYATMPYSEFNYWIRKLSQYEAGELRQKRRMAMNRAASRRHNQRRCKLEQDLREEATYLKARNAELSQQIKELSQREKKLIQRLSMYQRLRGAAASLPDAVDEDKNVQPE